MTTYAFPALTPNRSVVELVSNTERFQSGISGAVQTVARDGAFWRLRMNFTNLKADDKAVLKAFVSRLEGQRHRFTVHDHGNVQRGAFGGTPLVAGANQLGTQVTIDGATASVTNWIRAGDMFSVNGELKMCTADANSDGSGNVTVNFVPALRNAPADNAAITTANPTGTFMLEANDVGWSNKPGDFSDFTLIAVEDISA